MDKIQESVVRQEVADKLRNYRIENNLTQADIADLVNVDRSYISLIEASSSKLSINTILSVLEKVDDDFKSYTYTIRSYENMIIEWYRCSLMHDASRADQIWRYMTRSFTIDNSIFRYDHEIYKLVHAYTKTSSLDKDKLDDLLLSANKLSIFAKQLLFHHVGIYYLLDKNTKEAKRYFGSVIALKARTLAYAEACKYMIDISILDKLFIKAYRFAFDAHDIYYKAGLFKEASICGSKIADIYENVINDNAAINIYNESMTEDHIPENIYPLAIRSLFFSHDHAITDTELKSILSKLDEEARFEILPAILYQIYKRKDDLAFDAFYNICKNEPLISGISNSSLDIIYGYFRGEEVKSTVEKCHEFLSSDDPDKRYFDRFIIVDIMMDSYDKL